MARYRLYRCAVAGATGRVGEALTRQLLLSPLCSEVHALGRAEARGFDGLAAANAKLRQHRCDLSKPLCGLDASALAGVDAAFCVLGARGGWARPEDVAAVERDGAVRFAELCAAAGVRHLSLLSSAWAGRSGAPAFAELQAEAARACGSMAFSRLSVFRPAAVLAPDGRALAAPGAPAWAQAAWRLAPAAAQFLPASFRPVRLDDLALAMRLNVELCDASERMEMLGYRDMMLIIGRDGDA
mmetsp:Transcript_52728/g.168884  ORF Transcript_52728/g.168884 Transcript_52728/m.168884 type:complete len:242 (-) Transcript_52728:151-876(-)